MTFREWLRQNWLGYAIGYGTAALAGGCVGVALFGDWMGVIEMAAFDVFFDVAIGRTSGMVSP